MKKSKEVLTTMDKIKYCKGIWSFKYSHKLGIDTLFKKLYNRIDD